jgi:hypothetical protein
LQMREDHPSHNPVNCLFACTRHVVSHLLCQSLAHIRSFLFLLANLLWNLCWQLFRVHVRFLLFSHRLHKDFFSWHFGLRHNRAATIKTSFSASDTYVACKNLSESLGFITSVLTFQPAW